MGKRSNIDQKDVEALKEAGYDTDDIGRGNKAFNPKEVGTMTNTSSSDASKALHGARDDARKSGEIPSKKK